MGMMMGGGPKQTQAADIKEEATLVGTETITVPAGTFACQHYRTKDGEDIWLAEKAGPWGLVKMTSRQATMTLLKVTTDAKTKIKGTPKKFDIEEMMKREPEDY